MIFYFVFAPAFHRVEHLGTAAACSILVVVMTTTWRVKRQT